MIKQKPVLYIRSIIAVIALVGVSTAAAVIFPEIGKADTTTQYIANRCIPTSLIGHRGTNESGVRPNTLAALKKAVAGGAGTFEIDIHVTKSVAATKTVKAQPAMWVVNHDSTITRTVSGKSVTKKIATSTYAELKKLAPDLMTYSEALSYAKSVNRNLEVEIKPGTVSAARLQGLSDVLRKTGMQYKVTYSSFKLNMLRSYRAVKNRAGKTAFITNTALPSTAAGLTSYAASVRKYADVIVLRYAIATQSNITILKNNKLLVEVYTTDSGRPYIDGSASWSKYIQYGANGIITDKVGTYTAWCKGIQPKPIVIPPIPADTTPEPAPAPVETEPVDVPTPDPEPVTTPPEDPIPNPS